MTVNFSSVNALIHSGDDHLRSLNAEVVQWKDIEPYTFISERNEEWTDFSAGIRFDVWPDLYRWATKARSALNDYRSSLDHLLYALAVHFAGVDPPPLHDKLGFPICTTPRAFDNAISGRHPRLGKLIEVEGVEAAIKRTQPFSDGTNDPGFMVLNRLRELDDAKKHRQLIISAFGLQEAAAEFMNLAPGEVIVTIWEDPIEQITPLLRLQLPEPNTQVEMKLQVSIRIAFADEPKPRVAMLQVLSDIRQVVFRCRREITSALGLPYE